MAHERENMYSMYSNVPIMICMTRKYDFVFYATIVKTLINMPIKGLLFVMGDTCVFGFVAIIRER